MDIEKHEPSVVSVVTAACVRVTESSVRVGAPVGQPTHGEPKVQLIREDGAVRAIEVTCGCGEKIRIRCDYS